MTQTRTPEQILDIAKDLAALQALLLSAHRSTEAEKTRYAIVAVCMLQASEGVELDNETVLKYLENKYLGQ